MSFIRNISAPCYRSFYPLNPEFSCHRTKSIFENGRFLNVTECVYLDMSDNTDVYHKGVSIYDFSLDALQATGRIGELKPVSSSIFNVDDIDAAAANILNSKSNESVEKTS